MNVWPGFPCANVANNGVPRFRGKTSLLVFYDVFCTKTINCYYYLQRHIYEIFLNIFDVNQPSSFPRIIFNTRLLETIHFTICSSYRPVSVCEQNNAYTIHCLIHCFEQILSLKQFHKCSEHCLEHDSNKNYSVQIPMKRIKNVISAIKYRIEASRNKFCACKHFWNFFFCLLFISKK